MLLFHHFHHEYELFCLTSDRERRLRPEIAGDEGNESCAEKHRAGTGVRAEARQRSEGEGGG